MSVPLVVYCPKCHKKIGVPKFARMVNVQNGITVECADKKCGGKVKIKTENKELIS